MKTLILLSLALFGCSGAPVAEPEAVAPPIVFYRGIDIVTLDLTGAPQWAVDATVKATQFWAKHGLIFEIADQGEIPVSVTNDVPTNALGEYTFTGEIRIVPELEGNSPDCVIAHELGHSVSMMHVSKGGGMMSVYQSIWEDGSCMWNDADQAELIRILSL